MTICWIHKLLAQPKVWWSKSELPLDKTRASDREIIDIAVEFLFDGRPMSECAGHLLSEYEVNADDLGQLLERAQREVWACEAEFGSRLKF